jgi:predicted MFS family arabinose efflux permease
LAGTFFVIGGLSLVGMLVLLRLIPASPYPKKEGHTQHVFGRAWRQFIQDRSAVGALGYAFFISIANDNLFVVYGAWLEGSFDISIVALGLGTSIIGLAELCGESMTAFFSDRLGLNRSAKIGLIITAFSYLLLPLVSNNLTMALTGIFLIFLSFEFTFVTSISLCTELLPAYRATMMSVFYATAGIGRVLGALIGGSIWLVGGIQAIGWVSAVISLFAFVSLTVGLKSQKTQFSQK